MTETSNEIVWRAALREKIERGASPADAVDLVQPLLTDEQISLIVTGTLTREANRMLADIARDRQQAALNTSGKSPAERRRARADWAGTQVLVKNTHRTAENPDAYVPMRWEDLSRADWRAVLARLKIAQARETASIANRQVKIDTTEAILALLERKGKDRLREVQGWQAELEGLGLTGQQIESISGDIA